MFFFCCLYMTLRDKIYDFILERPKLYTFIILIIGVILGILGLIGVVIFCIIVIILLIILLIKQHNKMLQVAGKNIKTTQDWQAEL